MMHQSLVSLPIIFRVMGCLLVVLCTAAAIQAEEAAAEKITYDQHVAPIFRQHCGTCHNGNDKKGDLVLDNYNLAIQGGAAGEVIRTDGDAENSQLYRVVAHLAEPVMPPNQPKIPDEQIAVIKKWIEQGSLQTSSSKAKLKKQVSISRVEVSSARPANAPAMPEKLQLEPVTVSTLAGAVTALAANPWAPLVAVSGHKQVLVYHSTDLDLLTALPFPEGVPQILKFSRNGELLLAGGGRGGHSGRVVVWNIRTGERLAEIGDEYDSVLAADISADNAQVALGGPKKVVRVYSIETGEMLYEKKKHTDWITAIEFSPDGVLLATGDRSNGLIVWEGFTGREFHVLTGHTAAISDVSWSPDANLLASGSEDGTIRLWEMQNGSQVRSTGAHGGGVTAIEFLRDARMVSAGRDRVSKMWDPGGGLMRQFAGHNDITTEVAFDGDFERLFVGDLLGVVNVFAAGDGALIGSISTNPPPLATRKGALAEQLAAANNGVAAQQGAVAQIEAGIAMRQQALEAANAEVTRLEGLVAAAKGDVTTKEAELVQRQTELQLATQGLEQAKTELSRREADAAIVAQQLATQVATHAELVQKLAGIDASVAEVSSALAAAPDNADLVAKKAALVAEQSSTASLVQGAADELAKLKEASRLAEEGLAAAKQVVAAAVQAAENGQKQVDGAVQGVETAKQVLKQHEEGYAAAVATQQGAATAAVVTPEIMAQLAAAKDQLSKLTTWAETLTRRLARISQ